MSKAKYRDKYDFILEMLSICTTARRPSLVAQRMNVSHGAFKKLALELHSKGLLAIDEVGHQPSMYQSRNPTMVTQYTTTTKGTAFLGLLKKVKEVMDS